eukprot:7382079-Alexandrium_andersonii.AAC.1
MSCALHLASKVAGAPQSSKVGAGGSVLRLAPPVCKHGIFELKPRGTRPVFAFGAPRPRWGVLQLEVAGVRATVGVNILSGQALECLAWTAEAARPPQTSSGLANPLGKTPSNIPSLLSNSN